MEEVAAGFHPVESAYTCSKLHYLVSTLSDAMVRRAKIPITESLSAMIIPDSLGVLQPDEIFVSFSNTGPIDPITQCPISHLEGPVVAFRSPCKLPTDVRKFTAVYRHELAHLKDCIVMSASVACSRSPGSYFAGGDYDGDTACLIWTRAIVDAFENAHDHFASIPNDFEEDNFDKEVVQGEEFLSRLEGQDDEMKTINYQSFLLGALLDDKSTGHCQ